MAPFSSLGCFDFSNDSWSVAVALAPVSGGGDPAPSPAEDSCCFSTRTCFCAKNAFAFFTACVTAFEHWYSSFASGVTSLTFLRFFVITTIQNAASQPSTHTLEF
jgi:hypothetical protein